MPRMRTIKDAVRSIKESDPGSAFSEYALRKMVREGIVPHIMVGNRALVDIDSLENILSTGTVPTLHMKEPPLTLNRARMINNRTKTNGSHYMGNF